MADALRRATANAALPAVRPCVLCRSGGVGGRTTHKLNELINSFTSCQSGVEPEGARERGRLVRRWSDWLAFCVNRVLCGDWLSPHRRSSGFVRDHFGIENLGWWIAQCRC